MKIHSFRVVPALPERLQGLRDIAYNLLWSWDDDLRVVDRDGVLTGVLNMRELMSAQAVGGRILIHERERRPAAVAGRGIREVARPPIG